MMGRDWDGYDERCGIAEGAARILERGGAPAFTEGTHLYCGGVRVSVRRTLDGRGPGLVTLAGNGTHTAARDVVSVEGADEWAAEMVHRLTTLDTKAARHEVIA